MQYVLKKHKVISMILIHMMAIMILFSSIDVQAAPGDPYGGNSDTYDSWITDPYGNDIMIEDMGDGFGESEEEDESWWESLPDSIEEHLGSLIFRIASKLNSWFMGTDNYVNITIDGLILGRLAEDTWDFSIAQFGLEEGNPYGVAGARVYVILRNSMYAFFLVYACVLLVSQGVQNSSKAWLSLKEGMIGIVFAFMLTYLIPQIIDAFMVLRNGWMVELSSGISGAGSQTQLISTFYANDYLEDPANGLVSAVLLLALQFANFFYIGGYVSVAMQCCAMFAIFPVIALLSLKQKKMFTDWCAIFFSNLAIPLIDYLLFLIPTMINNAVGEVNFVTGIITIMIVWQIIPARTMLLRLFGNATGTNAGRGMAGLGALGMMAMRMMMMNRGGGRNAAVEGGGNEGFLESRSKAIAAEGEGEMLGTALQNRAAEMQDVDSLMSQSGTEHSHASFMPAIDSIEGDEAQVAGNVSGSMAETAEIDAAETALGADFNASATSSSAVNAAFDDGASSISTETLDAPEGVMVESYDTPEGVMDESVAAPANARVDASEMSMGASGSYDMPELSSTMNAGSVDEYYNGEAFKAQDVNMAFDDMRLRNLENMENTQSRIQQLETSLPQAQENLTSLETAQSHDQKIIKNAETQMETNRETIKSLSAQNDAIRSGMSQMDAPERVKAETQIKENNQRIQQLREENISYTTAKETAQRSMQSRVSTLQQAKTTYEQQTSQLASAKAAYGKQVMLERNFANTREVTGGSGKVYENAAQFRDAHAMNDMRKKQINHKNFDIPSNMRILSPQEKSDFYRQRAVYQATRKTVGVAATVGVGALAAGATAFGGPSAMVTAGVVGGMTGGAAGKKVGETVANAGINAAEVVPKAGNAVAKAADMAVKDDRRMFAEKKGKRGFSDTSKGNTAKQQPIQQDDIFRQHTEYAKTGHAELNAARGKQMEFRPDGNDSVTNMKK